MSKKSLIIPILSLMLMLPACIKDELTKPAKVFFEFELISYKEGNNLKSGPPFNPPPLDMLINNGNLTIESIEFDGRRNEGKDIFFISNLDNPLSVDLQTGYTDSGLSFDIPQGIYNRIDINLTLGGDNGIPLVLKGKMRKGFMDDIFPLRFEYNLHEQINIRAKPGGNADKIVLRKDTPSTVKILVDAGELFQFVNFPPFNDISISVFNDEEIIVISPESNTDLFNSMVMQSRGLEKAFSVIID